MAICISNIAASNDNYNEMTMDEPLSISAHFRSFEDFSSRMVLLPRDDSDCTGAKVGSHEVPTETTPAAEDGERCMPAEVGGSMEGADVDDRPTATATTKCNDAHLDRHVSASDQSSQPDPPAEVSSAQVVPSGYVLVEICSNSSDEMPQDLENIEFSELLSALREASFPLSLMFAPPDDDENANDNGYREGGGKRDSTRTSPTDASPTSESRTDSDGDDNSAKTEFTDDSTVPALPTLVSREEAAKYAKQAATELRGRLGMWGKQAATRAAEAAAQVEKMREERQRRVVESQQTEDSEGDGASISSPMEGNERAQPQDLHSEEMPDRVVLEASEQTQTQALPVDDEAPTSERLAEVMLQEGDSHHPKDVAKSGERHNVNPIEPCFIFLQTPSGFSLCADNSHLPPITNNSVVSVRLSKERACGKKDGYSSFQWFRSNESYEGDCSDDIEQFNWSILRGACYAAYQPNVSDAGHRLKCVIEHKNDGKVTHQTCHLPSRVIIDQSLFESVKATLLGGGVKTVTFGNLRKMDDMVPLRLKIQVICDNDFISSSSIFVEEGPPESDQEDGVGPVAHFEGLADAKPKLFDLICSSHGHLKLEAANRNLRESILLALGIANFKSRLSSLTAETNLFQSEEIPLNPPIEEQETSAAGISDEMHTKRQLLEVLERLLGGKDVAIHNLQKELGAASKELTSSRESERQMRSDLEKCKSSLKERGSTIESLHKSNRDALLAQEKREKALHNDKAVLEAAVEARDGKIETLTGKVNSLEETLSKQSEELAMIEGLKSNLIQTAKKCSTAERIVAKMKETESELQQDLKSANGIVVDLNNKFAAAKQNAFKCETELKKLKMERNNLKNKAEGLTKEMSRIRISKNNAEASELSKLKTEARLLSKEISLLNEENSSLQRQVEVANAEKKDALCQLEVTYEAHQQSITNFQQSNGNKRVNDVSSEKRIEELEQVITSMTEYLNAKEMQIETLKQVNKALMDDMDTE